MTENAGNKPLEIDDYLPEIMRRLFGRRLITSGAWELTVPQLRALSFVGEHDDCTMGKLARTLGIGMSAATGLVDRLVQQNLVRRDTDPADRRHVCLRLTAAGRRARESCRRERKRRMRAALKSLTPEQQAEIAASLACLYAALEATEP